MFSWLCLQCLFFFIFLQPEKPQLHLTVTFYQHAFHWYCCQYAFHYHVCHAWSNHVFVILCLVINSHHQLLQKFTFQTGELVYWCSLLEMKPKICVQDFLRSKAPSCLMTTNRPPINYLMFFEVYLLSPHCELSFCVMIHFIYSLSKWGTC